MSDNRVIDKKSFSSARKLMALMVTATVCFIAGYATVKWESAAMPFLALFLQGWMTILTLYFVLKGRADDKKAGKSEEIN